MFLHADVIVKAVMIGLAIASLVTWTIWLAKSIELIVARRAVAGACMLSVSAGHSLKLSDRRGRQMVRSRNLFGRQSPKSAVPLACAAAE